MLVCVCLLVLLLIQACMHLAWYQVIDEVDVLQELHMTGCMLMADDFCLVIAEGSLKSHKKYNRLMLNRIDWNQSLEEEPQGQLLCPQIVKVCDADSASLRLPCCGHFVTALQMSCSQRPYMVSSLDVWVWTCGKLMCLLLHQISQYIASCGLMLTAHQVSLYGDVEALVCSQAIRRLVVAHRQQPEWDMDPDAL